MIEYPPHIANLSRDYYHHRIVLADYREQRRKIIQEMERLHNQDNLLEVKPDHEAVSSPSTADELDQA